LADGIPTIGGVPLVERLCTARAVAESLVRRFADQIESFSCLPKEALDGDIARSISLNIRMFTNLVEHGILPSAEDLAQVAYSAARRAEEGVPLETLLAAYHLGLQVGWDHVVSVATPDDLDTVRHFTRLLMEYQQLVTTTTTTAYLAHHRPPVDPQQVARAELVEQLLTGTARADTAERAGTWLADSYTVLGLAIARRDDEDADDEATAAIAGRRKVLRVRAELEAALADPVLTTLGPEGGIVLIVGPVSWARLSTLVAAVERAAGVGVTASTAHADRAEIAETADQIRQVLDIVVGTGRPPGLYRLADVLLDYQLTRPGAARRALAALLDPLAEHPDLLATLEIHLCNDLNRRRTATKLHLHINTVDYRLRRIAELTGLDVTKRAGVRHLEAAMVARRMEAI
jgi:hypothetical protein